MIRQLFRGLIKSNSVNTTPIINKSIFRNKSNERKKSWSADREWTDRVGSLDDFRNMFRQGLKLEKTREEYMQELIARLDQPEVQENSDPPKKITKIKKTAPKSSIIHKKIQKSVKKSKKPKRTNSEIDVSLDVENIAATTTDRFPNLTAQIKELADQLRPNPSSIAPILELRQRLMNWIIKEKWVGRKHAPSVEIFGSTMNGLALEGSADVDLCLLTDMPFSIDYDKGYKISFYEQAAEPREKLKEYVVTRDSFAEDKLARAFASNLRTKKMSKVVPIPYAKVPIVKFYDPVSKMNADLSFNNPLGVFNTKLVRDYVAMDPRVSDLAFIVKYWSKVRGINDPPSGTLSSYAYVQLLLFYLQVKEKPLLPNLQDLTKYKHLIKKDKDITRVNVEGWNCTRLSANLFKDFSRANKESLGELLLGFFKYYAVEFDFANTIVSIRRAKELPKMEKYSPSLRTTPGHKRPKFIVIEDPFNLEHNLGRGVNSDNKKWIISEFERAYSILKKIGSLSQLLEMEEDNTV